MTEKKDAMAEVAKILKDSPDRWFKLVMVMWGDPKLTGQDAGELVGFPKKSARSQVSRVLKQAVVKKALAVLKEDAAETAVISRNDWMAKQLKIVKICMQEEQVEDSEGGMMRIFDAGGANKGLDNIAKAEGYYKDQKIDLGMIIFKQDIGSDEE